LYVHVIWSPLLSLFALLSQPTLHQLPLRPLPFFNHATPPQLYTLSLHDALPISLRLDPLGVDVEAVLVADEGRVVQDRAIERDRSEEHTSELQSRFDLVCRLLLDKKNNIIYTAMIFVTSLARRHMLAAHRLVVDA